MSEQAPELERAREQYRRSAPTYDRRTALLSARYRRRAVDLLNLAAGEVVLDVACGTGVNFGLIERRVGPTGRIVGVDASPDMLALARSRGRAWRARTTRT